MNLNSEVDYNKINDIIERVIKEVIRPIVPDVTREEVYKIAPSLIDHAIADYMERATRSFTIRGWRIVIYKRERG